MDRVIAANSVNLAGADGAPATGTPQYFTSGNPGLGTPATVLPGYWCNAVQEEIVNVILAAGLTPDKTNNAQLLAALKGLGKIRLLANATFYVATTGNNSTGNGTIGSPWALPSFAINYIKNNIDLNGFSATVQCADGAYTDSVAFNGQFTGGTNVILQGNASNNAAVSINDTTASGGAVTIQYGVLNVQNLKVTSLHSDGIASNFGARVNVNNVNFGACSLSQIHATGASNITINNPYAISGGGTQHILGVQGGVIELDGSTVTITGTPNYSGAFANIRQLSVLSAGSVTFTGTATGQRYLGVSNSVIDTNSGGSASYFPGNSAGAVSAGAIYL